MCVYLISLSQSANDNEMDLALQQSALVFSGCGGYRFAIGIVMR